MVKHTLLSAATALALAVATLGVSTGDAFAQNWSGHRGGGNTVWRHGGGGGWHGGGGWNRGWHGGGGGWNRGWRGGGGCWNCGWNGGWGWAPAFGLGLGLGYGVGAWNSGSTRVCEPIFRNVRVQTRHGWRWRNVVVARRCYWADYGYGW